MISTATPSFTVPKAKRQYDAVQVSMVRGLSRNWFMGGSYVWSRLYGNYAGLQNSDEIRTPTLGLAFSADQQQAGSVFRLGGNANRSWDLDESMWDAHGHLDPQGRLATDRPHVLKLYGATVLPFGTEMGVNFYAGSGTPLSTYVNTLNGIEVLVNGRGDMGRTPVLSTTDLLVSHQIAAGRTPAAAPGAQRAERLQPEDRAAPVQLPESRPRVLGRSTSRAPTSPRDTTTTR